MHTLVFDVYGTLVDTAGVAALLETRLGDGAAYFAKQWRNKQLEYSYRMGLMRWYQPFSQCAKFAFEYTCEELGVTFTEEEKEALFLRSLSLPAFDDAVDAMQKFSQTDAECFAFSNGAAEDVEQVLSYAGLRQYMQDVVSVDAIKIFKPSRIAYAYLLERIARYHTKAAETKFVDEHARHQQLHSQRAHDLRVSERRCLHYVEAALEEENAETQKVEQEVPAHAPQLPLPDVTHVWLVSSNPFDVIGAKVAGLQAVWIRRSASSVFDPWGVEPTLTVANLAELYDVLRYRNVITPL